MGFTAWVVLLHLRYNMEQKIEEIHYHNLIDYFKQSLQDEIYPMTYPRNESGFSMESLEFEIRQRLSKYEKLKKEKKK